MGQTIYFSIFSQEDNFFPATIPPPPPPRGNNGPSLISNLNFSHKSKSTPYINVQEVAKAREKNHPFPIGRGNIIQRAGMPPSTGAVQSNSGGGHQETVETQLILWSWRIALLATTCKLSIGYRSFPGRFYRTF